MKRDINNLKCSKCNNKGDFPKKGRICKLCISKESKIYRSNNKERISNNKKECYQRKKKEYTLKRKEYDIKNRSMVNLRKRVWKYGINVHIYLELYESQKGKCLICHKEHKILVIDHNHQTKTIRGLLCRNCNLSLGHFYENISILENSIKYLATYKQKKCYEFKYINRSYKRHLYLELFDNKNCCEICNKISSNICIDHCHNSKNIRGLLCKHCNAGIGYLKDDIEKIKNAIEYIKNDGQTSYLPI